MSSTSNLQPLNKKALVVILGLVILIAGAIAFSGSVRQAFALCTDEGGCGGGGGPTLKQCNDGDDNDLDGAVDSNDPGCHTDGNVGNAASYDPADNSEGIPPQCYDLTDNDGDLKVDFPADAGCSNYSDNTEINPSCIDGIDNDLDGKTDYPADPGCVNTADNFEENPGTTYQCNDGTDNDGDGVSDASDPDCRDPNGIYQGTDNDETHRARCADSYDNDADGAIDYPSDPGCDALTDDSEQNNQCYDTIDNDSDGLIDFPNDPGCVDRKDNDEANVATTRTLTVQIPVQENGYDNYARGQVSVSVDGTVSTCSTPICTYQSAGGKTYSLTATALDTDAGGRSFFVGWGGGCTGLASTVSASTTGADVTCTANFHRHAAPYPTTHTLTFSNTGNGTGGATYWTRGTQYNISLGAGQSIVLTAQDDQYFNNISAIPDAGMSTSYPNDHESCFQDGNVFIQHSRTCTVTYTQPTTLVCTPASQGASTGQIVSFSAAGGSGTYSWSASGGSPTTGGNTSSFSTSYGSTGSKTVTVTRGSQTANCTVNVTSTPPPPVTVYVRSNLAATFSMTGPGGFSVSNGAVAAGGTNTYSAPTGGSFTIFNVPQQAGYTLAINGVPNSNAPASFSQNGSNGNAITFDLVYTPQSNPPGNPPSGTPMSCAAAPNPVNTNTNTTFTAYNGTAPYTWSFPGGYFIFGPVTSQSASYNVQYTNTGTYNASLTDGTGKTASCSVVVGNGTPPCTNPLLCQDGFFMDFYISSPQNGIYGSQAAPTSISVAYGTNATLEWDGGGVSPTGCWGTGTGSVSGWTGQKSWSPGRVFTQSVGPITQPSSYTLRCYGFATTYGGTEPYIEKTATVNLIPTTFGTINVVSNVPTTWTITGGTSPITQTASSTGASYTVAPATYTITVPAITGYTVAVTPSTVQTVSANTTRTYTITYTPIANATVDIKGNSSDTPLPIPEGSTAVLTWATTNIQSGSCSASASPANAGWSGVKGDNGSQVSGTLSATTTFTITCRRASDGANIADSVIVPTRKAQCGDSGDNDGDTRIDYPTDPGCSSVTDDDESNSWPECNDGIDNTDSEDVLADTNDPGCHIDSNPSNASSFDPTDSSEVNNATVVPQCNDGLDNDGDGKIDYPTDDGCDSPADNSELKDPNIKEI